MTTTAALIAQTSIMAKASVMATELEEHYRRRVAAGADPFAEAEERDRVFYDGLVAAGLQPRDAARAVRRFFN